MTLILAYLNLFCFGANMAAVTLGSHPLANLLVAMLNLLAFGVCILSDGYRFKRGA